MIREKSGGCDKVGSASSFSQTDFESVHAERRSEGHVSWHTAYSSGLCPWCGGGVSRREGEGLGGGGSVGLVGWGGVGWVVVGGVWGIGLIWRIVEFTVSLKQSKMLSKLSKKLQSLVRTTCTIDSIESSVPFMTGVDAGRFHAPPSTQMGSIT